jgi:hypothetical protein
MQCGNISLPPYGRPSTIRIEKMQSDLGDNEMLENVTRPERTDFFQPPVSNEKTATPMPKEMTTDIANFFGNIFRQKEPGIAGSTGIRSSPSGAAKPYRGPDAGQRAPQPETAGKRDSRPPCQAGTFDIETFFR